MAIHILNCSELIDVRLMTHDSRVTPYCITALFSVITLTSDVIAVWLFPLLKPDSPA